jgi:hypothetical protein
VARKNDHKAEMDLGLVCPSCGVLSRPDPEALRAVVRDAKLWVRCLAVPRAIVMALLSRLADSRRQTHSVLSHD